MKLAVLALATATGVTALSQASISQTTGGPGKHKPSESHWIASYVTGSTGWVNHDWIAVAFAHDSERLQADPNQITLPANQVVEVDFSQKGVSDSGRIQGPRSGCGYAGTMMPDASQEPPDMLLIRKVDPSLASRLSADMMFKHPVRIAWKPADLEESVVLNVNDCEYESLVANLRWMLGPRWSKVSQSEFSLKRPPESK
jgi:hypothetical protein